MLFFCGQTFYQGIVEKAATASESDLQLKYPYPRTCTMLASENSCSFSYVNRQSTFTFSAEDDSSRGRLFVKFCKRCVGPAFAHLYMIGLS